MCVGGGYVSISSKAITTSGYTLGLPELRLTVISTEKRVTFRYFPKTLVPLVTHSGYLSYD